MYYHPSLRNLPILGTRKSRLSGGFSVLGFLVFHFTESLTIVHDQESLEVLDPTWSVHRKAYFTEKLGLQAKSV